MTQEKDSSKLDRLQGVLLDDRDFLKQVVQAFCHRLHYIQHNAFFHATYRLESYKETLD